MKCVCNYKIRVDDGYWKKWWMMSDKCKMEMQGAIGIAERVGWGATAKRSKRGRGGDDDGPRRVGSDLLAPACSRPDRLDPGDWPPSLRHQILLASLSLLINLLPQIICKFYYHYHPSNHLYTVWYCFKNMLFCIMALKLDLNSVIETSVSRFAM